MLSFRASIHLFATVTVIATYLFLMMVFYTYFRNLPPNNQQVKCDNKGHCKPVPETKVPDKSIYILMYLIIIFTIPCWAIYCAWRLKPRKYATPLPMALMPKTAAFPCQQPTPSPSENELPPSYQEIDIPDSNTIDGTQLEQPESNGKYLKNLRLTFSRFWFGNKPYTVMESTEPNLTTMPQVGIKK